MSKQFATIAAGLTLGASALLAQTATTAPAIAGRGMGAGFQQLAPPGPGLEWVTATVRPLNTPVVTGSPVSATEERKTVQTLSDGTVLERSDTNLLYRDSQGRTRMEQTSQGRTSITIVDPVAHTRAVLDPAARTVRKSTMPWQPTDAYATAYAGGPGEPGGRGRGGAVASTGSGGGPDAAALEASLRALNERLVERAAGQNADRTSSEDLGVINQNGVPARGTRTTLTIPVGQIGNNREIRVVNERWYSNELQMLVKSVNTDPRFGVTTYQLTNIVRANPDAGLFQIPTDYTVQEGAAGGRGGTRGGAGR